VFVATSGKLASFFSIMLALTISSTAVDYVAIFPALLILRRKYPNTQRPYRVPGGSVGAWAVVIITELFVVVTAITLLWPGAINNLFGQSYSIESAYSVSRPFFEWVTLGSMAAMIALGLVFWRLGERNRKAGLTGIPIAADPGD
jgi:glutamate:GABA antiporter